MRMMRLLAGLGIVCLAGFAAHAETLTGTFNFQPTSTQPNCVAVNPVTNRVYYTQSGTTPASVSVLDGTTLKPAFQPNGSITFGAGEASPEAIIVNPVTNMIYVVCRTGFVVVAIDGATNTVTAHIPVGSNPVAAAFNSKTGKLYVANYGDNTVSIIDTKNNNTTMTRPTGTAPIAVAVNVGTDRVFVANSNSNNITVIDALNDNVLAPIMGITTPLSMAVNPANNMLYVAGGTANVPNMFAIGGGGPPASATFAGGVFPTFVAANPLTGKVYFATTLGALSIYNADLSSLIQSTSVGTGCRDIVVNTSTNKVYFSTSLASSYLTTLDGVNLSHSPRRVR